MNSQVHSRLVLFVVAACFMTAASTVQASSSSFSVQHPSRIPIAFYNSSFPYGTRSYILFDSSWSIPFATAKGAQEMSGTLQTVLTTHNVDPSDPFFTDDQCTTFLDDTGAPYQSITDATDAQCGFLYLRCAGLTPSQSTTTLTLQSSECPTCRAYDYPVYRAAYNSNYLECGYAAIFLSTQVPPVILPRYSYAGFSNKSDVVSSYGASWEQALWSNASEAVAMTIPHSTGIFRGRQTEGTYTFTGFVPDNATANESEPLRIGPTTANASFCTINDVGTFSSKTLDALETLPNNYYVSREILQANLWTSVMQAHLNCLQLSGCVGYITYLDSNEYEVPYALVLDSAPSNGVSNDIPEPFKRFVFLRNTMSAACHSIADFRGTVAVYVEGTNRLRGEYDVFVNDVYVLKCVPGVQQDCGNYWPCGILRVMPGSVVKVVPTFFTAGMNCGHAHRVLFYIFSYNSSSVALQPQNATAPTTLVANVKANFVVKRNLYITVAIQPTRALMFVNNVDSVVFEVTQNGFGCSATAPCDSPLFTASFYNEPSTSDNPMQMCGGNLSFAGGATGESTQCGHHFFCTDYPLKKWVSGTPGYIDIGGDFARVIAASPALCRRLTVTVYAKLANGADFGGFPLLESSDETSCYFRAFLLDTSALAQNNFVASTLPNTNATTAPTLSLVEGLVGMSATHVYQVDWRKVPNTMLSGAATLTCIVDFVTSKFAYCVFPIPSNATSLVLTVENHNLLPEDNILSVTVSGSTTGASDATFTCGGTDGMYGGDQAVQGNCGQFIRCVNTTLLDPNNQYSYQYVVVQVPAAFASEQICFHSVVVRATYSTVENNLGNIATQDALRCRSEGNFYCRLLNYSMGCIPASSVCNAAFDCFSHEDELFCGSYDVVEYDHIAAFNSSNSLVYPASAQGDCVRYALVEGSAMTAANSTHCVVYTSPSMVNSFIASPEFVYAPGFELLANVSTRNQYGHCTDSYTCRGRGTAVPSAETTDTLPCICICQDGYYGANCEQQFAQGPSDTVAVTVDVATVASRQYVMRCIAFGMRALSPFSLYSSFSCTPLMSLDSTTGYLVTFCRPNTGSVPPTLDTMENANMKLQEEMKPLISVAAARVVSVVIASNPQFDYMQNCSSSLPASSASCGFATPTPSTSIFVTAQVARAASIVVTALVQDNAPIATRRSSSVPYAIQLACSSTAAADASSCLAISCVIPTINVGYSFLSINASVIAASTQQPLPASDMCQPITIVYRVDASVGISGVAPPPGGVVHNAMLQRTSLLSGTVVLFIAALLFLVPAMGMRYLDVNRLQEQLTKVKETTHISDLHRLLRQTFLEMRYYESPERVMRLEKWSVAFFVLVGNCVVAAIFLLLYFSYSEVFVSNSWILVERYGDAQCGSSIIAPLPYASYVITDDSALDCVKRTTSGAGVTSFFAAGTCEASSAMVRVSSSDGGCLTATPVRFSTGVCIPSGPLWGNPFDTTYSVVYCGSHQSIQSRFSAFAQTTTAPVLSTDALVQAVPPRLKNNWTRPVLTSDGVVGFAQAYRFQGVISYSLSLAPTRTATVYLETESNGFLKHLTTPANVLTTEPSAYMVQFEEEVFSEPNPPYYYNARSTAYDLADDYKMLPTPVMQHDVRPVSPPLPEFPVGRIFNGFNTSSETVGASIRSALLYYNVAGSPFDLGSVVDIANVAEGDGITVSFYVRASLRTRGFVFATVDAYENPFDITSPLIDRLAQIVESHQEGEDVWYHDMYHVYSSVYLNGAAGEVSFVYASPAYDVTKTAANERNSSVVTTIMWSLRDLNAMRVFNGAWHQLAITFVRRNAQLLAQLTVDGETSQSIPGWNKCIPRPFRSVFGLPVGASVRTEGNSFRVMTGGQLIVGALNGGVASLQVTPSVLTQFQQWRRSSVAIQDRSKLQTDRYIALGSILIALACIFFGLMIFTSFADVQASGERAQESEEVAAFFSYVALLQDCLRHPEEPYGYKLITCRSAMKWLNLSEAQFTAVLEEVKTSTSGAAEPMCTRALLRILYHCRTGVDECPSVATWNELVEAHNLEQAQLREAYDNSIALFRVFRTKPIQPDQYILTEYLPAPEDSPVMNVLVPALPLPVVKPAAAELSQGNETKNPLTPAAIPPMIQDVTQETSVVAEATISGATSSPRRTEAEIKELSEKAEANKSDRFHKRQIGRVNTGVNVNIGQSNQKSAQDRKVEGAKLEDDPTIAIQDALSNIVALSFSAPDGLLELIHPVMSVTQLVLLWLNSIDFANLYDRWFRNLFAFLSIEIVQAFPHIPPLVTPLLQMFFGLIVLSSLLYHAAMDEYVFAWYVARYTLKRDIVTHRRDNLEQQDNADDSEDHSGGSSLSNTGPALQDSRSDAGFNSTSGSLGITRAKRQNQLPRWNASLPTLVMSFFHSFRYFQRTAQASMVAGDTVEELDHVRELPKEFGDAFDSNPAILMSKDISVIPLPDAIRVDNLHHIGCAKDAATLDKESSHHGRRRVTAANGIDITQLQICQNQFLLQTPVLTSDEPLDVRDTAVYRAGGAEPIGNLKLLGIHCQEHRDRLLTPQLQTDVWPFICVPTCCVIDQGQRCGVGLGVVYHCGHTWYDRDGSRRRCGFALCERHFRGGFLSTLRCEALGVLRYANDRGFEYVTAVAAMVSANTFYTPIVKTALMMLACHPAYQCILNDCWRRMDTEYVLTAYLSIAVLVLFGLGLPCAMLAQLYRRRKVLVRVFFADEYKNRYAEKHKGTKGASSDMKSSQSSILSPASGSPAGASSSSRLEGVPLVPDHGSPSGSTVVGFTPNTSTTEEEKKKEMDRKRRLQFKEWSRFMSSDPTIMSSLYRMLKYQFLYLSPVLLFWKALLIAPAVFIPANTFGNSVGIASVETAFALFLFVTSPFISPMVDLMYRLGCVHQLLLLGVQNFNVVVLYESETSSLSNVMVAISLFYLAFCLGCILWTVVGPQINRLRNKRRINAMLQHLGITYSMSVSLYVMPTNDALTATTTTNATGQQETVHVATASTVPTTVPVEGDNATHQVDRVELFPQATQQEEETMAVELDRMA